MDEKVMCCAQGVIRRAQQGKQQHRLHTYYCQTEKEKQTRFNGGRPYHGTSQVSGGRLTGKTDTDYFYFVCPQCRERHGIDYAMRILEYGMHHYTRENKYNGFFPKCAAAKYGFTLVFKIRCENCKLTDFVKVGNLGRQAGAF